MRLILDSTILILKLYIMMILSTIERGYKESNLWRIRN